MYGGSQDNGSTPYGGRARMPYNTSLSEEKENTGESVLNQYGHSKLSLDLERNGRTSAASGRQWWKGQPSAFLHFQISRDATSDSTRAEGAATKRLGSRLPPKHSNRP